MHAFAAAFVAVVTAQDRQRRRPENRTACDRWLQRERVAYPCPRTDATDLRPGHCACRHQREYSRE